MMVTLSPSPVRENYKSEDHTYLEPYNINGETSISIGEEEEQEFTFTAPTFEGTIKQNLSIKQNIINQQTNVPLNLLVDNNKFNVFYKLKIKPLVTYHEKTFELNDQINIGNGKQHIYIIEMKK